MAFLSTLAYFIIVIAILVVVHEFGHFITARLSGMRTDIFSVGMGYRLFGFNKITGFTFGNLPKDWEGNGYCDYRLSLFPIGGYVKIVGMVDESFDTEYAAKEPQPWEFRSKGVFAKLLTLSGGVLMNFLLAVAIFAGIMYSEGRDIYVTTEIGYVEEATLAQHIGFQVNDKVVSINGNAVRTWDELTTSLTLNDFGKLREITVARGGNRVVLTAHGDSVLKSLEREELFGGLHPAGLKVFIKSLAPTGAAEAAGLLPGDTLVSINNKSIVISNQVIDILQTKKSQPVWVEWKRGTQLIGDTLIPDANGIIGIEMGTKYIGEKIHTNYSIWEAGVHGFEETVRVTTLFVNSFIQLARGALSFEKSFGGPILIAKKAAEQAEFGLIYFLNFIGLLSISLAIINILPIPALDGGHLVIVLIEAIIRRELPVKVKMIIQQVGFVFVLLLMALIFYNDIMRL